MALKKLFKKKEKNEQKALEIDKTTDEEFNQNSKKYLNKAKKKPLNQDDEDLFHDEEETNVIYKENRKLWRRIGICACVILIIIIVACFLNIYKAASSINYYFGIIITSLLGLVFVIFCIFPIIRMFCTPSFTLDATKESEKISNKNYRTLKAVAKNLTNEKTKNSIPLDVRNDIKSKMNDRVLLKQALQDAYKKYISKDINKLIIVTSIKVAVITGVSKNSFLDTLTTIFYNIRLMMRITVKCGYRPTYIKLAKLFTKVLKNALVAYTMQSVNLGTIITNLAAKFAKSIPGVGEAIEGGINGVLTLRVGTTTKKFLYGEFKAVKMLTADEQNVVLKETEDLLDEVKEEAEYVA